MPQLVCASSQKPKFKVWISTNMVKKVMDGSLLVELAYKRE